MAIANGNIDKNIVLTWDIENFNFCWHKTGERLETPLFNIHASCKTAWKLWLYPRGEDDGEYISCYLFREEGGPEAVEVDFKLGVYLDKSVVSFQESFSKIYSFKCCQKEGLKCFVSRRQVFAPLATQKKGFTLTFVCNILNMDKNRFKSFDFYFRTVIETESISSIEIFDDASSLNTESAKSIEVKGLLEEEALLNINVSYFEKSLVIKVYPKSCRKIKYAVCKISIMEHWSECTPIHHVRTWIGEINADIWKYYVPEIEPATRDLESSLDRPFLLHYDLAFSTGSFTTYFYRKEIYFAECFNANLKNVKSPETVLAAMENVYRNHLFTDVEVKTCTETCFTHKAILQARCPKLRAENKQDLLIPHLISDKKKVDKFLMFLYCDKLEELHWSDFSYLYQISTFCKVELLKRKCVTYLKDNLDIYTAIMILILAGDSEDLQIKNFVVKYVITHADDIFVSRDWRIFSHSFPKVARKVMLSIYKIPKSL